MATKTIRVDDIDGTEEGVETVHFAFKGKEYSIDLSAANQKKLADALAPYISAGTKAGILASLKSDSGKTKSRPGIVKWARENNHPDIQDYSGGRIPNSVVEAYDAAH